MVHATVAGEGNGTEGETCALSTDRVCKRTYLVLGFFHLLLNFSRRTNKSIFDTTQVGGKVVEEIIRCGQRLVATLVHYSKLSLVHLSDAKSWRQYQEGPAPPDEGVWQAHA